MFEWEKLPSMPIHKMHLEDGVFFAKPVGYLDNVDARMWVNALRTHAEKSAMPITAVVDMLEVSRICPTVPQLFATAASHPNIRMIVLATGDSISAQKARVIDQISQIQDVRVASGVDDARKLAAGGRMSVQAAGWNSYPAVTFATCAAY